MSDWTWRDFGRDLSELILHPRRWLENANHVPCPACGQRIRIGYRRWQEHKLTHTAAEWRAGLERGR